MRSINSRLRKIVLVPMAVLIALWLVVTGYLAWGAIQQYAVVKGNEEMMTPAAIALTAVMDERSATVAHFADHDNDAVEERMMDARETSDKHMNSVLDKFEGVLPYSPEPVQKRIRALDEKFAEIDRIRRQVDEHDVGRKEVLDYYNSLSLAGANLFDEQSRHNPSKEVVGTGLSATYTFRVVDTFARADARIARAFATGELSTEDQNQFARLVGSYHGMLDAISEYMGPEQTRQLEQLRSSSDWKTLVKLEDRIAGRTVETETDPVTGESTRNLEMPVDEKEWREVYDPIKDELTDLGASQALWSGEVQSQQANQAIVLALSGSLGMAGVAALAFMYALRSSRALVTRLHRLRDDTQELTSQRLPSIMDRLRRQEPVDIDSELPDLASRQYGDEIGQVARSFDTAHRTAVETAVRQAELRHGVNRVFLNIAHRSQTLVHRQLRLLDRMERDQEDPDQLTELFKLDHLATRSRRNAENLLILGGETPGRTWHRPMPLVDVLRGAISESGDYTRVARQHMARVSLKGPAVADVIHLVAELVDNATTFSPPHSVVRLSSEQVPNGVTVEIEDRGLGMQDEEFAAANELLENPPEFDVMRLNEKMRLGLFVVSRLARRHGISVRLRTSPYGGVQAIVLLPSDLIEGEDRTPPTDTGEHERIGEPAPRPLEVGAVDGGEEHGGAGDRGGPARPADGPTPETPAPAGALGADVLDPTTPVSENGGQPHTRSEGHDDDATRTPLPRRSPRSTMTSGGVTRTDSGPPRRGTPGEEAAPPATPTPEEDSGGRPALPKRRPQQHLAPQLYEAPTTTPTATPPAEEQDRSERLRRNMAAFQQGTRRGRREGQQRQNDSEKES